jgi:hypothetical protein
MSEQQAHPESDMEYLSVAEMLSELSDEEFMEIGRLAVQAHFLFDAVMCWMDEQTGDHKPRREDAPMWRMCTNARRQLDNKLNEYCGFDQDDRHLYAPRGRTRRKGRS